MGREARRQKTAAAAAPPSERRIALERGDYCELAMLGERMLRLEHEARASAAAFAAKIADVQQRSNALLERLGQAHGFKSDGMFKLEDKNCTLVVEEPPTP